MPYLGVAAWTVNKPKKTLFSASCVALRVQREVN
jgi:hypothetical protein